MDNPSDPPKRSWRYRDLIRSTTICSGLMGVFVIVSTVVNSFSSNPDRPMLRLFYLILGVVTIAMTARMYRKDGDRPASPIIQGILGYSFGLVVLQLGLVLLEFIS